MASHTDPLAPEGSSEIKNLIDVSLSQHAVIVQSLSMPRHVRVWTPVPVSRRIMLINDLFIQGYREDDSSGYQTGP